MEELEKKWDILLAILLTFLTLLLGGRISSDMSFTLFVGIPIGVIAIFGIFLAFPRKFSRGAFKKVSYKKDLALVFLTPAITPILAYILSSVSVLFVKNHTYLSAIFYDVAIFFFFFAATSLIFLIKYLFDTASLVYASNL
jgi:cation transport ATPase